MSEKEGGNWKQRIGAFVREFKVPRKSVGNLDAESAAALITAAADIALAIDRDGVIRDIAVHSAELWTALEECRGWVGRHWHDVVTVESRPKVEAMLRDALRKVEPRWRHLNHPVTDGTDIPVLYSAVQVGEDERVVVIGRDLRAISALQQRLIDAQQSMEDDYTRLQHMELRYRLLFQQSSESILILDSTSQKVIEANPAAGALFGDGAKRMIGRGFVDLFDDTATRNVQSLLNAVRATGRGDDVRARLASGEREVHVSASLFRQESTSLFLVRLSDARADVAGAMPQAKTKMLKLLESAPDGFVVTDDEARIMTGNAAFLDMAQLANEEMARGELLERWIGRPGVDVDVLVANLRQRGSIRLFATTLNGELGVTSDVEVSAVSVMNGSGPCFGFTIRNVARRISPEPARSGRQLPHSVEQLTELIGRVPLKDLVRETTDVIERLCIEAALELTNDNRAGAAEMLGLSRQSLYVKLRRFGLADATAPESDA